MNIFKQLSELHRKPDDGYLFGVCAGLADYYGWRVRTVRFVVVALAILVNWPIIVAYLVAGFLLPSEEEMDPRDKSQARAGEVAAGSSGSSSAAPPYTGPLRERYERIEKRMRRVEAYLHGQEYELRSAFRDLETSN